VGGWPGAQEQDCDFWLYFYFNGLEGVTMPGFEKINRQCL
jgi:hypothetical protein